MDKSLFAPVKELGQNFLTDENTVQTMLSGLELNKDDNVVEIGPGLGALTVKLPQALTSTESHVYAVEIDDRFVSKLNNMFLENMNVDIIQANILDWLPTFKPTKPFKLIASVPYYITSPIIHKIIYMEQRPTICILLVQKEVAERIKNTIPDATYLSSFVQTFYEVSYLGKVDRKLFDPEPEVDGGILKLVKKDFNMTPDEIRKYEGFLHKGYSNPRKMLNKVFTKEELAAVGIDSNLRAQNLDVETWLKLFKSVTK